MIAQNIYAVSFMPTEPGIYSVELFFNCHPLKGLTSHMLLTSFGNIECNPVQSSASDSLSRCFTFVTSRCFNEFFGHLVCTTCCPVPSASLSAAFEAKKHASVDTKSAF